MASLSYIDHLMIGMLTIAGAIAAPSIGNTKMDLFDILSHDERVIVLSNEGDGTIITWNQSATLQCWKKLLMGEWEEIEIRTLSSNPPNDYAEARKAAMQWQGDMWSKD